MKRCAPVQAVVEARLVRCGRGGVSRPVLTPVAAAELLGVYQPDRVHAQGLHQVQVLVDGLWVVVNDPVFWLLAFARLSVERGIHHPKRRPVVPAQVEPAAPGCRSGLVYCNSARRPPIYHPARLLLHLDLMIR